MTPLQILQLRAVEIRARLAALASEDTTDETRAEIRTLTVEYADNDSKAGALLISEDQPTTRPTGDTSEGRETLELRQKATLAGFVQNIVNEIDEGPEHEFRQAIMGDGAKGYIPLAMLLTPRQYRVFSDPDREVRAITPVAAAAITEGNQDTIAGRVFARSIPAYLGIPMPGVAAGASGYPRLSGGTTFSVQAGSGEQAAVAGTFAGSELNGIRATGSYEFQVEDVAKLVGLEDALRVDLQGGIENLLNQQSVNGSGAAPQVSGFLHALTADPNAVADADTFAEIVARFMGLVDGINATSPAELRLVMRSDIFSHMSATYATNDDSVSAYDYLLRRVGGAMVNNIVPAKDNNDTGSVIVAKTGYPERGAVMPVWDGFRVIADEVTLAQSGQVRLTAIQLFNFAVLDSSAFAEVKVRTS